MLGSSASRARSEAGSGSIALGVVTEDLQAAVSVAGRLQQRGLRVEVVDDPSTVAMPGLHAIVVDLLAQDRLEDATDLAEQWTRWLRDRGCLRVEQRVDSAFRGTPADVHRGVLRGAGARDPIVAVVTGYPTAGRICIDGEQRVHRHGQGVETIKVAQRLELGGDPVVISVDALTLGIEAAGIEADRAIARGHRSLIFDAANEGHLEAAAGVVHQLEAKHEVVAVSSGGWLRCHPALDADGFVVVAATGAATLDRQQLARVADVYGPAARVATASALLRETDALLLETVAQHRVVVVQVPERTGDAPLLAAEDVAAAVRRLLDVSTRGDHPALGVVVSGGVTSGRTIRALDAVALRPGNELEPLCPVVRLTGGPFANLAVITKASSIGAPDTLVRLVRRLTGS